MEYLKKQKSSGIQGNSVSALRSGEASSQIPNSALCDVMAGKTKASSEMMGHRQNLAPSLAAKMSKAFGMDLSQMQVYRSGAMQGTGMQGLASGNKIVLSRDIDLNTMEGQAVLGHEISHVHAQSQGIGMGNSGLYQNAGLEHQADMEGMMAARGQSILGDSTGMDMGLGMGGIGGLTAMGPGMSASAGAPMQAKKGGGRGRRNAPERHNAVANLGALMDEKDLMVEMDDLEKQQELAANQDDSGRCNAVPDLSSWLPEEEKVLDNEDASGRHYAIPDLNPYILKKH